MSSVKRPTSGVDNKTKKAPLLLTFGSGMNILLLKVTIMPLVVGCLTLITRRWGHRIGGLIASMPWVAGPILLFFILEQGVGFGIRSVPGILTGVVSLIGFCLTYASLCRRLSWLPVILLSYAVYVLIATAIDALHPNLYTIYAAVLAAVFLALRFFPVPDVNAIQNRRLPFDIPIRMVVATVFVIAITELAHRLGPAWSGILTPFPIITSILAIFTHVLQSGNATIATLRGLIAGLPGFTTFLFLQAFLLREFSVGVSFALALVVNAAINVLASRLS